MKTVERKVSEQWFESYAIERGLDGARDHQPALGGTARPDFRVSRGSLSAIVEVKEFETSYLDRTLKEAGPRNVVMTGAEQELSTVRHKIGKAAKVQLRPYVGRGEPLIVCLANPRGVWVDLGADEVLAAMYGDPGFVFDVDVATGEAVNDPHFQFGRNGAFVDSHRYVSAIMTLHRGTYAAEATERWYDDNRQLWASIEDRHDRAVAMLEARDDEGLRAAEAKPGDFYFTRVYETKGAALGTAERITPDLFDGPRDEFWQIDSATGTIAPLPR